MTKNNEKRKILKFDEHGIPYHQETDVPGINPLRRKLTTAVSEGRNPLVVVGDISGMGKLNNQYGREIADDAILAALRKFVDTFAGTGTAAGSPSGDEIWAVSHPRATAVELVKNLKNYLEIIQNLQVTRFDISLN